MRLCEHLYRIIQERLMVSSGGTPKADTPIEPLFSTEGPSVPGVCKNAHKELDKLHGGLYRCVVPLLLRLSLANMDFAPAGYSPLGRQPVSRAGWHPQGMEQSLRAM
jgi:hypothetical protein